MIKIFQGFILDEHWLTFIDSVFMDSIFPNEPLRRTIRKSNWQHPGCYWMILE